MGRGLSASELANELNVSVKTIETHQMRMKEKLGVRSAAELRQKAREWQLDLLGIEYAKSRNLNKQTERGFALIFEGTAISARGYSDLVLRIRSDALLHDSPHLFQLYARVVRRRST